LHELRFGGKVELPEGSIPAASTKFDGHGSMRQLLFCIGFFYLSKYRAAGFHLAQEYIVNWTENPAGEVYTKLEEDEPVVGIGVYCDPMEGCPENFVRQA